MYVYVGACRTRAIRARGAVGPETKGFYVGAKKVNSQDKQSTKLEMTLLSHGASSAPAINGNN